MNGILRNIVVAALALLLGTPGSSQEAAPAHDFLTYALTAKPGDLTVDQMPGPAPKSYREEFMFKVSNPTRTDYRGKAETTQIFDVEVFAVGIDKPMSVWKWSTGMKFGQIVTPVSIPAGQSWEHKQKIVWNFKANEVQEGKYLAVATFLPTGNKTAKASFNFKIVH
jgi:hypothetical protein